MSSTKESSVYDQYEGNPIWASRAVWVIGSLLLMLSVGLVSGRFIQILQYAGEGLVPLTTETFLAEFSVASIVVPLVALTMMKVANRKHEAIDEVLQPWIEVIEAHDRDEQEVIGPIDNDMMTLCLVVLKGTAPVVVIALVFSYLSAVDPAYLDLYDWILWPFVVLSAWLVWRQLREKKPESMPAYLERA